MKFVELAAAILFALIVQTTLGRYFGWLNDSIDLFTVVVASWGLVRGRLTGMAAGVAAGLVQDAFSGGLLGFNGIAKTTVGYLAGILGRHLIVRGTWARIVFFLGASAVDLTILTALGWLVQQPRVIGEGLTPIYVCSANAIAGILFMRLLDRRRTRVAKMKR